MLRLFIGAAVVGLALPAAAQTAAPESAATVSCGRSEFTTERAAIVASEPYLRQREASAAPICLRPFDLPATAPYRRMAVVYLPECDADGCPMILYGEGHEQPRTWRRIIEPDVVNMGQLTTRFWLTRNMVGRMPGLGRQSPGEPASEHRWAAEYGHYQ